MSEPQPADVTAWGFEFRWRNSGSMPLEYRPVGGCDHDWVMVGYNSALIAAVRALYADAQPEPEPEPYDADVVEAVGQAGEAATEWGMWTHRKVHRLLGALRDEGYEVVRSDEITDLRGRVAKVESCEWEMQQEAGLARERIAELEAENKRLRQAMDALADTLRHARDVHSDDAEYWYKRERQLRAERDEAARGLEERTADVVRLEAERDELRREANDRELTDSIPDGTAEDDGPTLPETGGERYLRQRAFEECDELRHDRDALRERVAELEGLVRKAVSFHNTPVEAFGFLGISKADLIRDVHGEDNDG